MAWQLNAAHASAQGLRACWMPGGPNNGLWDLSGNGIHPIASPNAPPVVRINNTPAWEFDGTRQINLDPVALRLMQRDTTLMCMFSTTTTVDTSVLVGGIQFSGSYPGWLMAVNVIAVGGSGAAAAFLNPFTSNHMIGAWNIMPQTPVNDGNVRLAISDARLQDRLNFFSCPTVPPAGPSDMPSVVWAIGAPGFAEYFDNPDFQRIIGHDGVTFPVGEFVGQIFGVWLWSRIVDWDAMATDPFGMFIRDDLEPPPVTAAINVAIMA